MGGTGGLLGLTHRPQMQAEPGHALLLRHRHRAEQRRHQPPAAHLGGEGLFWGPPGPAPPPPPRLLTAPPRGGFFLVVLQKLPGKFKNLFRKFENLTVRGGGVWGTHGGSACKGGWGCL